MSAGRLFRVEWNNPYTEPPDGAPRILAEIFLPDAVDGKPPPEIRAIPVTPGGGYSLSIRAISPPSRQLPVQTLARVRRKRLERRVRAKTPLFADEFIAGELARKPDYYAGITDPGIEARKQAALEHERAEREVLLGRPNTLIVYGAEPETCRLRAEQTRREFLENQELARRNHNMEDT